MARPLKSAGPSARAAKAPRADRSPAPEPEWLRIAAALGAAIAAASVFRGALAVGFSQDDFLGLARATGLAPRLEAPWRWLSHQGFWDALVTFGGRSATTGHGIVLAAWALAAALLAWLLARRLPAPAALVGAAFVATHPAAFTALHWLAANGDVFAVLFALAAAALAHRRDAARWAAVPVFVAALACKESVLPLPLALVALRAAWRGDDAAPSWRDPLLAALAAVALAWALAAFGGARTPSLGGEAYGTSAAAIGPNLLTYHGWALQRWWAFTHEFTDAVQPGVYAWGAALAAACVVAGVVPALRRRGGLAAALAWAAMLLPVLPLAHHTNHYYLLAALPALGLLVAAASAAALERLPRAAAWALAAGVVAALAADAGALVDRIASEPFLLAELRADPTVDRARIAANVGGDLAAASLPAHSTVWFWSPRSRELVRERGGDATRETYFERNLRAALLEGLAVRVMAPAVDSVRFVDAFDSTAVGVHWGVIAPDGRVRVVSTAELAPVVRASRSR